MWKKCYFCLCMDKMWIECQCYTLGHSKQNFLFFLLWSSHTKRKVNAKATLLYWILIISTLPATPSKSEGKRKSDVKWRPFSIGFSTHLSEKWKKHRFHFRLWCSWTIIIHVAKNEWEYRISLSGIKDLAMYVYVNNLQKDNRGPDNCYKILSSYQLQNMIISTGHL